MILPVLDLMKGQIVRGIAGRRAEYRPLPSRLVDSADPLAVATALKNSFGFCEYYLADLDAIAGGPPDLTTYQKLQDAGLKLWIDAGLRTHRDRTLKQLIVANPYRVIAGLESLQGPDELRRIIARLGVDRVVFSLDLQSGRPLGRADAWEYGDPFAIASRAVRDLNVTQMVVLDLASVGMGQGVATESLCRRLKETFPLLSLITGGGVASIDDVHRLSAIGVERVLVASALHDGRITPM